MDRALKHGLGGIVQADAFEFSQSEMFATLQRLTLLHRLNDSYTCLVSSNLKLQSLFLETFLKIF